MPNKKYENTRQSLLMRVKDPSNEQAWEDFVFYYKGYIAVILRNFGVDEADLDDILQKVLLKCWKSLEDFEYDQQKGRFRYWLSTLTLNTARNHFDQIQRRRKLSDAQQNESEVNPLKNLTEPEVERITEQEWKIYISRRAWDILKEQLKPLLRECFQRDMDGESIEQISSELEIAENTVYVYKKRVRKMLLNEIFRLNNDLN